MAALARDVRFRLVQLRTDFLQGVPFQDELADLLLARRQTGANHVPRQLIQFLLPQMFAGMVHDALTGLGGETLYQSGSLEVGNILQVGDGLQCLLLLRRCLARLAQSLGEPASVVGEHVQHQEVTRNQRLHRQHHHFRALGAYEECHQGYCYHSDDLCRLAQHQADCHRGKDEQDEDVAQHRHVVEQLSEDGAEHTVHRQLRRRHKEQRRHALAERDLLSPGEPLHHDERHRMQASSTETPGFPESQEQDKVIGHHQQFHETEKKVGDDAPAVHHAAVLRAQGLLHLLYPGNECFTKLSHKFTPPYLYNGFKLSIFPYFNISIFQYFHLSISLGKVSTFMDKLYV